MERQQKESMKTRNVVSQMVKHMWPNADLQLEIGRQKEREWKRRSVWDVYSVFYRIRIRIRIESVYYWGLPMHKQTVTKVIHSS